MCAEQETRQSVQCKGNRRRFAVRRSESCRESTRRQRWPPPLVLGGGGGGGGGNWGVGSVGVEIAAMPRINCGPEGPFTATATIDQRDIN